MKTETQTPPSPSNVLNSPFRSNTGQRYNQGLFLEYAGQSGTSVMYTLRDQDYLGYPSLYRLYLEANDPTEFLFATKHLESYEHWLNICSSKWFQPYAERWRKELELKIRAEALARVLKTAQESDKMGFAADRFLLSGDWHPEGPKRGKGRPSKAEIKADAEALFLKQEAEERIREDYDRLMGTMN